jgi:hypothetical protein
MFARFLLYLAAWRLGSRAFPLGNGFASRHLWAQIYSRTARHLLPKPRALDSPLSRRLHRS